MADLWMWQSQEDYDEWLNELMENTPDSYDGDEAAEAIFVKYVRDLEGLIGWLLDGEPIVIDSANDEVIIEDRFVATDFMVLVKHYVECRLPDVVTGDDGVMMLSPVPWEEPSRG